jgi:hypothetical protein
MEHPVVIISKSTAGNLKLKYCTAEKMAKFSSSFLPCSIKYILNTSSWHWGLGEGVGGGGRGGGTSESHHMTGGMGGTCGSRLQINGFLTGRDENTF